MRFQITIVAMLMLVFSVAVTTEVAFPFVSSAKLFALEKDNNSADKNKADNEGDKSSSKNQANRSRKKVTANSARNQKRDRLQKPTPQQEKAAILFVREHHSVLESLLTQLKENRPRSYYAAIHDLYRNDQRLAKIKKRDLKLYEMELALWEARSRMQLVSARLTMSGRDELRDQLSNLLDEHIELRSKILHHSREKLVLRSGKVEKQLKKIDDQLENLDKNRSQVIEKQLRTLTKKNGFRANGKKKRRQGVPVKKNAADLN